jgi:flagella basal body P-ring formation protein FlgA
MLCRLLKVLSKPLTGALLFAVGATGVSLALAQGEGLQARLLAQLRQSVAQSQNLPLVAIEFAPLDPRVQLQDCNQPLVVDWPFASRETVRVRCTSQPGWQLYLRLQSNNRPGTLPGPANAANASQGTGIAQAPAMRGAVVARQLVQRGAKIDTRLFEEVSLPAQGMDHQAVASLRDLMHGELVRDVAAGQVIRSHDIRRAVLVKQGQATLMTVGSPGDFQISVRVEALQDGRMGEQIRLKNPESGRLLSGVVVGPNAVRGI